MSICKNTIKYFFANLGNFLQLLEHELIQILVSNLQIFMIAQGAHGNGTNSQIFVILRKLEIFDMICYSSFKKLMVNSLVCNNSKYCKYL